MKYHRDSGVLARLRQCDETMCRPQIATSTQ